MSQRIFGLATLKNRSIKCPNAKCGTIESPLPNGEAVIPVMHERWRVRGYQCFQCGRAYLFLGALADADWVMRRK